MTRADLPAELTAESLRHLNFRTLRTLARPGNGVLDAGEQQQFDAALAELSRDVSAFADESLRRARRGGPENLDPALRRSFQRTQQRLAAQAEQARRRLPPVPHTEPTPTLDEPDTTEPAADDDLSPDTVEQEVEQTSETLDMLERIASLQQQQLEHQKSKLLSETRGLFFAFLVSVTVIIAGVAPLVEASSHDRVLIIAWTLAATAVAGLAYAVVRWFQVHRR